MYATDKQVALISALLDERNLLASPKVMDEAGAMDEGEFTAYVARIRTRAPSLPRKDASAWITRLLELPKLESKPDEPIEDLPPAGRYAIEGTDGEWSLLRVWRGTRNSYIVQVYEVKGTEKGTRLPRATEKIALRAIAKNPGQAAIDFGHRTDHCSRCGIELERNLSRRLGIGPECIKHWFGDDERLARLAEARNELRAAGIDPEAKYADLTKVVV